MDYSEKLNYLFNLTHAEGKELAAAMHITPPQISKMRKGTRGLPRNLESAQVIAQFFAQRCTSSFQRERLAEAIGAAGLTGDESSAVLTGVLLDWLADERDPDDHAARRANDFLRQFGAPQQAFASPGPYRRDSRALLTPENSSFFTFYGSEGRREAVLRFLHYLIQMRQAFTVNILTDEDIGWVTAVPGFSQQLQASMVSLTEQGCVFRRIAAPIMDMDRAFESLNRWLPLYLTGKATSYYYNRMRDNLNHITIFSVTDVAVMFAFSVGTRAQESSVTFFSTDKDTVNSMTSEFEHYLSVCEPIMRTYSAAESIEKLMDCMLNYEECKAACIQRSNSLSLITLPWDIAVSLNDNGSNERKDAFLASFVQRYKRFKQNLEQYPFTDIIRLAEPSDIMSGSVPISAACIFSGEHQYYSPIAYLQHLRSILFLLEHFKNYNVVVRRPGDTDPGVVYVKEGRRVILLRESYPFSLFEVSERYLIDAFAEFLYRMVPSVQSESTNKRSVAAEIRGLIAQVEHMLRQ